MQTMARKVDPYWAEQLRTMPPETPPESPSPAPPDPGWRIWKWGLLVIALVWTGALWALAATADDSYGAAGAAFFWIVGMGVWVIALVIVAIAYRVRRAKPRR